MEAFEKIDLIGDYTEDKTTISVIYKNSSMLLDRYINLIYNCHLIIIERQLSKNYKMVRFSQHIISYLIVKLMNNPCKTVILEVDSKLKSRQLAAPKGLNAKEIKKWAIQLADRILKARQDQKSLSIIKSAKSKKDDLSDTVIQIEAIFSYFDLPITQLPEIPVQPSANNYQLYNPNNSVGNLLPNISPRAGASPRVGASPGVGTTYNLTQLNLTNINLNLISINQTQQLDLSGIDFSKLKI